MTKTNKQNKQMVPPSVKIKELKTKAKDLVKRMNNKPSYDRLYALNKELSATLMLLRRYERAEAARII